MVKTPVSTKARREEWRYAPGGVYYDFQEDHLVLLQWIGNRFYVEYETADVTVNAKSKRSPSTLKAGLIYVGEL